MNTEVLHFEPICPFDMTIKYVEIDSKSPENVFDSHVHEECEIYINISGDVSFMVENRIYPIKHGDIIITRPYEYHHCIYHSNKLHKHFWILFSSHGNEKLLDSFFNRKSGEGNHLSLSPENTERLFSVCRSLSDSSQHQNKHYLDFFEMIELLRSAEEPNKRELSFPRDVAESIKYINENYNSPLSVKEIAQKVNVSTNTLERHFSEYLNQTPTVFIRKKRLPVAAKLLSEGFSVTEVSEKCGFSDYSNFIFLFRKTYGTTPYKYQKSLKKQ